MKTSRWRTSLVSLCSVLNVNLFSLIERPQISGMLQQTCRVMQVSDNNTQVHTDIMQVPASSDRHHHAASCRLQGSGRETSCRFQTTGRLQGSRRQTSCRVQKTTARLQAVLSCLLLLAAVHLMVTPGLLACHEMLTLVSSGRETSCRFQTTGRLQGSGRETACRLQQTSCSSFGHAEATDLMQFLRSCSRPRATATGSCRPVCSFRQTLLGMFLQQAKSNIN